ncbi:hypothetical protein ACJBU6_02447 [Exserohilum turcicum]
MTCRQSQPPPSLADHRVAQGEAIGRHCTTTSPARFHAQQCPAFHPWPVRALAKQSMRPAPHLPRRPPLIPPSRLLLVFVLPNPLLPIPHSPFPIPHPPSSLVWKRASFATLHHPNLGPRPGHTLHTGETRLRCNTSIRQSALFVFPFFTTELIPIPSAVIAFTLAREHFV